MKMKNIISLTFISLLLFIVGCSKVPYYDIPTINGKVGGLYEPTVSTNTGITTPGGLLEQQVPVAGEIAQ